MRRHIFECRTSLTGSRARPRAEGETLPGPTEVPAVGKHRSETQPPPATSSIDKGALSSGSPTLKNSTHPTRAVQHFTRGAQSVDPSPTATSPT